MMEKYLENNANRQLIEEINAKIESIAFNTFGKDRVPTRDEIQAASKQVTDLTAKRELLYWMGRRPGNVDKVADTC